MSGLITTEYILGYVEALKHLEETLNTFMDEEGKLYMEGVSTDEAIDARISAYEQVIQYIVSVRDSYKQLVAKLNKDNQ